MYLEITRLIRKNFFVRLKLVNDITNYDLINFIYVYFIRITIFIVKKYIDRVYNGIKFRLDLKTALICACVFLIVIVTKLKVVLLYLFYCALHVPGA